MSNEQQSRGYEWEVLRDRVVDRDGHVCQNCNDGAEEGAHLQAHHIVPSTSGGEDTMENLVTLCERCHKELHRICEGADRMPVERLEDIPLPCREKGLMGSVDRSIIHILSGGRNTPSNMARRLNQKRSYIHRRLKLLEASDHVEKVNRGLYGLGPAFESEAESGDLDGCADIVLRARKGIEDVLDAMDRNDGQAARRAAEDVRDVLNEVDV